jgi:hypothetical protein
MADPTGKASGSALRVDFARCVKLQFHGAVITSAAGVLAYRELDAMLGSSACGSDLLTDARRGRNGRHVSVDLNSYCSYGQEFVSWRRAGFWRT